MVAEASAPATSDAAEETPFEIPVPSAPVFEDVGVPPDRIYVFYPEEPFGHVYVGNKLLQFKDGRLMSDIAGLRPDDLRRLAARVDAGGLPMYLFWQGDPRKMDQLTQNQLFNRCADVAQKKAAASNALKIIDDARFMMMTMLAVGSDRPQLENYDGGGAARLRSLAALMPSAMDDPVFRQAIGNQEAQERDAAVIAAAASGRGDDTPKPEGEGEDDTPLPESFAPPPAQEIARAQSGAADPNAPNPFKPEN